jgi:hemolysin activation/secretion protein
VGSTGAGITVEGLNSIGFGDELLFGGQFTEGVVDAFAGFELPLPPRDTKLFAAYRYTRGRVVEEPFSLLDIESRTQSVRLGVRHPLLRGRRYELTVGLLAEWRETETRLFGEAVCFEADADDCSPSIAALRLRQEFSWRGMTRAVVARSTLSFGLDILGATRVRDSAAPDGEYIAWLAQFQWAELLRLPAPLNWFEGSQLLMRGDLQLANDPLLNIEQIALGGAYTVRGYRQNQLIRDNGVIASIELRVPIYKTAFGRPVVELGPFFDVGHGWDESDRFDAGQVGEQIGPDRADTLASVGLAIQFEPVESFRAGLSWAHRILDDDLPEGDTLQKHGLYFEVVWDVF